MWTPIRDIAAMVGETKRNTNKCKFINEHIKNV